MISISDISRTASVRRGAVLVGFAAVSLLLTYPVLLRWSSAVLGPPGDNFEYLYKLWWFKRALFDLQTSPFFTADVFYPQGYHLALHEMSLTNIALGMPLLLLSSEVIAYNALTVFSFALSGFAMYVLILRLSGSGVAGLLSGIAYAFSSYRMAQLGAGHLNLLGTQWLPLLLLCLEDVLRRRRWVSAVLSGLFFALSSLSSWYYAPMFALVAAGYVLVRQRYAVGRGGARAESQPVWLLLAASVAIAGVLMTPVILQTAAQWLQRDMTFSLREVDQFSASPGDLLVPNVLHPLWGQLSAGYYANRRDVLEHVISLSWTTVALAALGLCLLRRARDGPGRGGVSRAFGVILLGSVVLLLGTTLHVGGCRVYISVPDAVERAFTAIMGLFANRLALHPMPSYYELRVPGSIYLPLPVLPLYLFVPFFESMRVWTRFGLVTTAAVSALAGLGLVRLRGAVSGRGQRWPSTVAAICLVLLVAELWPVPFALGWTEVKAQPVDEWLASQAGGGAVIQFPLSQSECGPGLYAHTLHGKPLAYGYGAFFPSTYRASRPILWEFPSSASLEQLREWDVRYVLVGAQSYGSLWPGVRSALAEANDLRLLTALGSAQLYHPGWLVKQLPDLWSALVVDDVYVYELLDS